MKQLYNFINEKLKVNSKTQVNSNEIEKWDKIINEWIKNWSENDFEYLIELIDMFLDTQTFDNNHEYGDFLKYENNKYFKEHLIEQFEKFKKDIQHQINNLNK